MAQSQVHFWKMDGTGNDFIILDGRNAALSPLTPEQIQKLAARAHPITHGCDQLVVLGSSAAADGTMDIYNNDGSRVDACGNATRCAGFLLSEIFAKPNVTIATAAGLLHAQKQPTGITVNMAAPRLGWQEIPLSQDMDTLQLPITEGPLQHPTGTSMGNPHMSFFVEDVNTIDFNHNQLGHRLEHHPLFPEKANVGVAQVISPTEIHLRVYERGAGETLACGTGACAAVVAGVRRGLLHAEPVTVHTRGGDLHIHWQRDSSGDVWMTGPVKLHHEGTLTLE